MEFQAKVILNGLHGNAAALDYDSSCKLYQGAYSDPDFIEPSLPHDLRVKAMRESPYFNALQVKYAYAVTCHKAQGDNGKTYL